MPSPVGHSLVGCAIYVQANDKIVKWKLFFYVLIANLADFDFVLGFLRGEPNSFHRGASHSLGIAILFGVVFALIAAKNTTLQMFFKNIFVFGGLYFSHVLLDFFSVDTSSPIGEKLLWPLSNEYFVAPFQFFLKIERSVSSNYEFIITLFNFNNLLAILVEIVLLLPVLVLAMIRKRPRNRQPVLVGDDR